MFSTTSEIDREIVQLRQRLFVLRMRRKVLMQGAFKPLAWIAHLSVQKKLAKGCYGALAPRGRLKSFLLHNNRFLILADLVCCSESELRASKGFGDVAYYELTEKLKLVGLKLNMPFQPPEPDIRRILAQPLMEIYPVSKSSRILLTKNKIRTVQDFVTSVKLERRVGYETSYLSWPHCKGQPSYMDEMFFKDLLVAYEWYSEQQKIKLLGSMV